MLQYTPDSKRPRREIKVPAKYRDDPYDEESIFKEPWDIQSIYELNYFCCATCTFRDRSKQKLVNHAVAKHPDAVGYLMLIQDGSLGDVDIPWEPRSNDEDEGKYKMI